MSHWNSFLKRKITKFFLGIPALLIIFFLFSCYRNQLTGRMGLVLVSDQVMNDLGDQSYREVTSKAKLSSNSKDQELVKRVSNRIAKASGESFAWKFKLIEDPSANAFCLPGGKIVVYTGILAPAKNEAALAFIVGHEVGHAVGRHGAQRLSTTLLAQGALFAVDTSLYNNPKRDAIMAGLGLGAEVGVLLPYSRSHESEADYMGLIYMARAGYDPKEAPKFWKRMGSGQAKPPEFLSTHPNDVRRAKDLNQNMAKALEIYAKVSSPYGIGDSLP